MAVTSRSKTWEILHSIWILWTFTLLFNWIAFLYIGIRGREKRWRNWALLYMVPFWLSIIAPDSGTVTFLAFVLWIISVIHAFRIRKEYLTRLDKLQQGEAVGHAGLQHQAKVNRVSDTQASRSPQNSPQHSPATQPSSTQVHPPAPPIRTYESPSTTQDSSTIDLNNASERELASLPGIGIIVAKRAVKLRESRGGFRSVEDFGEALNLKPHIVERINPLVSVSAIQQSQRSHSSGRIVDY